MGGVKFKLDPGGTIIGLNRRLLLLLLFVPEEGECGLLLLLLRFMDGIVADRFSAAAAAAAAAANILGCKCGLGLDATPAATPFGNLAEVGGGGTSKDDGG